jgi:hypothetical protein
MAVDRQAETDEGETLEEIVARIRARGRGVVLPRPPEEAVRAFLAYTAAETPLSPEEVQAWDRAWTGVMREIHERDRADDIAEGRVEPQ